MWTCPACSAVLEQQNNTLRCVNGHSYDKAKEGYVNLLLAHQKRSKEPGDNKQMINARRAFLENNFYLPLAQRLAHIIHEYGTQSHTALNTHSTPSSSSSLNIFDAGCGEGYYLNVIKETLLELEHNVQASGCDISKIAVQKAAKKYKNNEFCVASTFSLPLPDASQNAVVQVFAPSSESEVLRVLKKLGIWLQVNPASSHLNQLKDLIYDAPQTHEKQQNTVEGFEVVLDEELSFDMTMASPQDTLNLLMMTPYYWSSSPESIAHIQENLKTVSTHFHIRALQKV